MICSQILTKPFPHFIQENALSDEDCDAILYWFENSAPWRLKITEFYQQYELNFNSVQLPGNVSKIFTKKTLGEIKNKIEELFLIKLSDKVDIAAHKLIHNQSIDIHNDYVPGQESHRVLIQLNRGWVKSNGGFLMLFSSSSPEVLHSQILPVHNTLLAFEISKNSLHSVSNVNSGNRFTLVISFYREQE